MELKFGGTQCAIAFALEVERGTNLRLQCDTRE